MALVVTLAGSPAQNSASQALLRHVERRVQVAGHRVHRIDLRDLPPAALLSGQFEAPGLTEAIAAVAAADGVVLATPVYKAAYSGLLKTFLDVLPQYAFAGKPVLPLVTGGSPAHVLVLDYALRPVLHSLGAAPVVAGWFVPADHLHRYPDGGLVVDPASAGPVADVTDGFLAVLAGRTSWTPPNLPVAARPRVSSVAGHPDLQALVVGPHDPLLHPLLDELRVEYATRYATDGPHESLTEVPATDFEPPHGCFVVIQEGADIIAGGALRRYQADTAEVKRVWTSLRHRRRGLGLRLMAELESTATELGYRRIHLTTGPRQPEARSLYLRAGYQPRFDPADDPEAIGPHAFGKELHAGAGLVPWPPVPADHAAVVHQ
jgi:SsuE family FMN reductase